MSELRQALIGAGANLGDRCATLQSAVQRLRANPGIMRLHCSPVYETAPVGGVAQPPFLNAVLGCETTLGPEALLALLQAIELEHGRVREIRWGPRRLDLDLLVFEGETRSTATLTLPHPRMLERSFVTVPLRDVLALAAFHDERWSALRTQLAAIPTEPLPRVECALQP